MTRLVILQYHSHQVSPRELGIVQCWTSMIHDWKSCIWRIYGEFVSHPTPNPTNLYFWCLNVTRQIQKTGQSANLQPECGEYVSQTKTEYYEFMRPSQNLWMCITAKKYCEHGWMGTSVFVELAGWNHFNIKLKLWITFQTNWMLTKWSIFRIFSNIETNGPVRKYLLK